MALGLVIALRVSVGVVGLGSGLGFGNPGTADDSQYRSSLATWRREIVKDLTGPKGWLKVSGLFWLKEGSNSAGSAPDNGVVLPKSAPAHFGRFIRTGSDIRFEPSPGESTPPTNLTGNHETIVGPLTIVPIIRGARVGLRLYDSESKAMKTFKGLKWYPIQPSLRVLAQFVPYPEPKSFPITNVLGDTQMWPSPGYVTFEVKGTPCKLVALAEGDTLFFNFHDLTSGKSTYPAGRFLYAAKPTGDKVELDFNKATNPPCAFTSFATCPLPPSDNFLKVEIAAGEKTHHPVE